MKINHILVLARNVDAMHRFFIDAIGLDDGPRPPFPFPGHWCYSEWQPLIHIASAQGGSGQDEWLGESGPMGSGVVDHIAFTGDDFQSLRERLSCLGILASIRQVPLEGLIQVFVPGPEGIKIEIQFPQSVLSETQLELSK
jgi:catechol 2,3-dioxygenase-like lactoylglutathione lyase family enzyme